MKKYLLVLLMIIFIVPSIALASWWNPFSWSIFHKKEVAPQVQIVNTETTNNSAEEIKNLQKQIDDLKNQKSNSGSKPITPKAKATKLVVPVVSIPIVTTPEIIKPDNTGICNKTKDTLAKITSEFNLITQETSSIYSDYRDAKSSQNSTLGVQNFNYLYNKMVSDSSGFYGKIDQLQIDTMGLDSFLSGADLIDVKSNLNNGGNTFKQAFDLMMQTFKYAGVYIPNDANLENAKTTLQDAVAKEKSAVTYFFQATSKMDTIKKTLSNELAKNGCSL